MDENDGVSSSVVTSVSESPVSIAVPRDDQTLAAHVSFEGQIEGCVGDDEGGEVMAEVVGSDVFVDGVGGDYSDKLGSIESGEECSREETENFDGGGEERSDPQSREAGENSDLVTQEDGRSCDVARDGRTETELDGFPKKPDLSVNKAGEVVTEGVEEVASSFCKHAEEDVAENTEVSEKRKHGDFAEKVVQEGIESVRGISGGSMSGHDLLAGETCDPGTKDSISSSPVKAETSGVEIVNGIEVSALIEEKPLNCKDKIRSGDVSIFVPLEEQCSDVEMVHTQTDKDTVTLKNTELLDEGANLSIGIDANVIEKEKILSSKKGIAESDVSVPKSVSSVDDEKMMVEMSSKSTENDGLVQADLQCLLEPSVASAAFDNDEVDTLNEVVPSHPNADVSPTVLDEIGGVAVEVVSSASESLVAPELSNANDCEALASSHRNQASGEGEKFSLESQVVGVTDNKLGHVGPTSSVDNVIVSSKIAVVECGPESDCQRSRVTDVDDSSEKEPELNVQSTMQNNGIVGCPSSFQNAAIMHDEQCDALHSGQESLLQEDCVSEEGEVSGMNPDELPPSKNGVQESDHVQKNECINSKKIDESSENDVAFEHLKVSGEQTQILYEGDVSEVTKTECEDGINVDSRTAVVLTCKEGESINIPANTKMTDKDSAAQVNAAALEKQTTEAKLDPLSMISQGNFEVPVCDAVNASPCISEEGEVSNVESALISTRDNAVGPDENLGAVVHDDDSSIPEEISKHFEGFASIQNKTQDADEQAKACTEIDHDKSEHGITIDEISNNACKEVFHVTESQLADICDHEPSLSTSDFTNLFLDEHQNSEIATLSNVTSLPLEAETAGTRISDLLTPAEGEDIAGKGGYCDADFMLISDLPSESISHVDDDPEVDEQYTIQLQVDTYGGQDTENIEHTEPSNGTVPEGSVRVLQSSYLLPPENEGEFSVSDLVWGKVRSHPWWPGQIFDSTDASEYAIKYQKKDCFLVAYFGDRTFAWNDASLLKPFRSHFYQVEKQSNSEAFQNAVDCALEEVSRRVELGLACSCWPGKKYAKIESQFIESTGIREESSRRCGVDKSSGVSSFQPDKLVEYMRAVAQFPTRECERLELVIAKAQLFAFCTFKGFHQPPEFQFCGELVENDVTSELTEVAKLTPEINDGGCIPFIGEQLTSENDASLKHIHNLNDSMYPRKKERSLTELMGDVAYSLEDEYDSDRKLMNKSASSPSSKKRKPVDSIMDLSDNRKATQVAKVSTTASPSSRPFFKVGECIRRVASQLTASPSLLSSNTENFVPDTLAQIPDNYHGGSIVPAETSLDEMLSQLHLVARDPKKGYNFFSLIISFFSGFRDSVVSCHSRQTLSSGRFGAVKRKKSSQAVGSPEEFEFEDVNDSYWTDRMIHNYPEDQMIISSENGDDRQLVAFDQDKFPKPGRRSRKRYSSAHQEIVEKELPEHHEERKEDLPVELVLNFAEAKSLPSEMNLNKMFRRFGPLKDYETEVDRETGRARVVFKRGTDAEVAFSSAGKFNIFGPLHVNYQLNYSPSIAYRPLPLEILQEQDDAT